MGKLERGTQIIYVPSHADGCHRHPDCEAGFVITDKGTGAFCRYWSRVEKQALRTKANSEMTPKDMLVVRDTTDQKIVDEWIKRIEADPERYGNIG